MGSLTERTDDSASTVTSRMLISVEPLRERSPPPLPISVERPFLRKDPREALACPSSSSRSASSSSCVTCGAVGWQRICESDGGESARTAIRTVVTDGTVGTLTVGRAR